MRESRADVVIIGGGIVGCATAYYLARRGVDVALVEKGEIADEQSSRAWGFVRQQGRDPAEMPLAIASNAIWRGLEAELGADIEWTQGGNLALAGDVARLDTLRSWLPVAKDFGLETRLLSRAEVRDLIPALTGHQLGGMYTAGDGHAEPRKATVALAEGARRAGARILTYHAAEGIERAAGRVSAVVTDRGTIRAPVVVNAAGARAMRIARMVGLPLPLLVVRSTVAETTPLPPITAAGVWGQGVAFRQKRDGSCYVAGGGQSDYDLTLDSFRYLRQFLPNYLKNRRLFRLRIGPESWNDAASLVPGSEARRHPFAATVGIEPRPNATTARQSLRGLARLVPLAGEARLRRAWAGLIDATPDAIPVLGEARAVPGFIFATGFSGHGPALGPIAGKLTAELIVEGQPSLAIHHMDYARFAEGRIGKPKNVV